MNFPIDTAQLTTPSQAQALRLGQRAHCVERGR